MLSEMKVDPDGVNADDPTSMMNIVVDNASGHHHHHRIHNGRGNDLAEEESTHSPTGFRSVSSAEHNEFASSSSLADNDDDGDDDKASQSQTPTPNRDGGGEQSKDSTPPLEGPPSSSLDAPPLSLSPQISQETDSTMLLSSATIDDASSPPRGHSTSTALASSNHNINDRASIPPLILSHPTGEERRRQLQKKKSQARWRCITSNDQRRSAAPLSPPRNISNEMSESAAARTAKAVNARLAIADNDCLGSCSNDDDDEAGNI
eukprot:CAMPEP_0119562224 /NCGR_PEP_ID=MMETSP1352-20130426/19813_1 /TAXON_ID=265584 /ORGANISM="Stauroneis constricta, Strain CCMP1120" /LENGTH=262 /DNA_ID=CAMNT_0007610579 /DNA_START=115 /DNA_END=903 /DNA_ORIENTATION=-